ncbi:hypothetical protein PR202_gb25101 [Eleusine coracana subsp. coracana]|uniref:P-type Ca(2+) transporter n=1 Tax=Eleusine coracana subsp. coracana TaxID=191504 RepID=A0AAV5FMV8_ELECO|nr:hypothetical protein PR202_gb25101 [Eleusine coracana subsp. coracana]
MGEAAPAVVDEEEFPAWSRSVEDCESAWGVSATRGLSSAEAAARLRLHGPNELTEHPGPTLLQLLAQQFEDTLVRILLAAAAVSFLLALSSSDDGFALSAFVEPLVIFLILVVNAAVGIWQETNAEKALAALKEIQSDHAAVLRDSVWVPALPARDLVPGDVVQLRVGDKVPADMRVARLVTSTLRVEQGSLTGETASVNKTSRAVAMDDADIQAKECMVFAGTTVVNGSAIHEAAQEDDDTPLKKKLNEFGEMLTKIIGIICVLVWLINVKYFLTFDLDDGWVPTNVRFSFGKCTYYFEIAVALAVAAIPEGLPAVITTCLALGTRKMAAKNALMSVAKLVAIGDSATEVRSFKVDGTTYDPRDGKINDWPAMDANLETIAKVAAVCNDATVAHSPSHQYVATGMPTEAALKVLVEKMGLPGGKNGLSLDPSDALDAHKSEPMTGCCTWWNNIAKRIATLEFDRTRKSMGVIVKTSLGNNALLVKGAVETLLERSSHIQLRDGSVVVPLDEKSRKSILDSLQEMKSSQLKLYVVLDPPREEVFDAIEDCRAAGIRVMVITGDNKETAEAICREIGVFSPGEDISLESLTGKQFMALEDKKTLLRRKGGLLFSRAEPRHKQEIVRLLKEDGEVVAMTGDGVNDAPALKLADIGVAMGITGTEVAKEASDMVLADDNFSTIVAAVGEGRSIYNNMKAFIRYMISSNIGEVASIFLTSALGIPEGLIPVQLLWVNLVTDGPPATALGFNPPDKDIMKKPPRRSDDSLITPWILFRYLIIGLYVGVATVGIFVIWYTHGSFMGIDLTGDGHSLVSYSQLSNWGQCPTWDNFTVAPFTAGARTFNFDSPCEYFEAGKVKATTLSLSVLVAIEMFNSLNALSEDTSLLRMPPWVNPWLLVAMSVSFGLHFLILYVPFLAQIFGIVPLSLNEWLLVLLVAFPVVLIDEVLKFVGRCMSPSGPKRTSRKLKGE